MTRNVSRATSLFATVIVSFACLATVATSARAQAPSTAPRSKAECVASYTEAQRLRQSGRLRDARSQLLSCSHPSCPGAITAECIPWLAEVERVLPTVVFEARQADGSDAVDVTVFVDGEKVEDRLDGRAIPVDPGAHLIRFVGASRAPLERRVVLAEGEKTRVLRVELPPTAILTPVPPPVGDGETSSSGAPHWSTYVLGGASVLSFGGFAYFGLTGLSGEHGLRDCKPDCPPSRTDPVSRDYLAADVFLGVGIATAAAAVIVALTTRHHGSSGNDVAPAPAAAAAQVPSFDRSMLK